ncbi:glycosyltransferase family 4 protein [Nonlabens ponticola]|uniref:Glycosyltransferase n=1 Tax=Nonlabens ponticola TaxID=2496866 RepID=A0A3S9MXA3_9FLAO|nr:glycosyltransferase family 4 protein [Nonlabens ponticola]AZQ43875.1 glycosyltransferase [Nonlabens ponticola]
MSDLAGHIAVVCNYQLREDRIGGMDRFFVRYDAFAKANNYKVSWYFSNHEDLEFYRELDIVPNSGKSAEQHFIDHLNSSKYSHVVTHFTSLCSNFHKKIKQALPDSKLMVVDHNPRPLHGFTVKKRLKNRLKAILFAKYVDQWIGVSNYTVHHIIKDLGNLVKPKTRCIYNGIDVSVIPSRDIIGNINFTAHRPLRLMIVSHLRHSKGIQDAIAALGRLSIQELNSIEVTIYGEGPFEAQLRQQVADNNLDLVITFKGSSPIIPQLLQDYDYLLQPTYMECFSLSILESLAANLPVITTTVGGNLEVIHHEKNGFIFEPQAIDDLVTVLHGIVHSRLAIEEPTRPLIKQEFYLDKMVQEHFNLID